ncbi:hypothetical protein Q7O_000506 [Pectobacterium carotovorum subsp. carotovorum PCCS1]|nr:hypothetical protein [Pectobacterium carotovorum subsp. carotovorum PCCS1]
MNVQSEPHRKRHPDVPARFRFVLPEPRSVCHYVDDIDDIDDIDDK